MELVALSAHANAFEGMLRWAAKLPQGTQRSDNQSAACSLGMSEYQRAVWASYCSVTYGAPLPNLALS
jgi:hypothetical protein